MVKKAEKADTEEVEQVLDCGHTEAQHETGLGRRDLCPGYSDLELRNVNVEEE